MNDGEALRRAVIANRDDDTPRLIYADWLDENGQSDRAAFIRAQVDAARAEPFSPLARAAESKAHLLLESHRKDWTRHLHGRTLDIPRFQRGFIEHVAVKPIPIESVASIFDIEPLKSLRIVRLNDDDEWQTIDSVLKLPQLFQINRLELSNLNRFEHHEYQTLLTSPNLSNIRELSLRNSAVQPSWFVEMLSGNAFPNLNQLDVAEITNLGPSLLQAFNRASHRQLRCLDASGVFLSSEQMQQVLAAGCISQIEVLRLRHTGFAGGVGPLFHLDIGWVIPWTNLVVLDLGGQLLGDDAVRAIASQDEASSLRWLGLANNALGPDAIRLLLKSKLNSLHYLDVRGNRFTPLAIASLKERFPEALIMN